MPRDRHDIEYLNLLRYILNNGTRKEDRTGTGTVSVFGQMMKFNLRNGFPLLTTKKVHFKSIAAELFWFMRGETNVKSLQEQGITIWDEWADENGELGPVYGKQWRDFNGVDQLKNVWAQITHNPTSRRIVMSAWNPKDIDKMALPPCHVLTQFEVNDGYLNCCMYQRSCDMFLGVPFNIASYSLLTHVLAHMSGLQAGTFTWMGGDCHVYLNHLSQVHIQLARSPIYPSPVLIIKPKFWERGLHNWSTMDVELFDYQSHGLLKGKVSV